jgi:ribonuclease HII
MGSPRKSQAVDRFAHERGLLAGGIELIAGVDEAGRGPLAGPVVVAAAILPVAWVTQGLPPELKGLNDSKQLTAEQREDFFEFLCGGRMEQTTMSAGEEVLVPRICFAIAIIPPSVIDLINILQATHRGMNEALAGLRPAPKHALVDGLRVKTLRFPQTPIVQGDALSYSIAAASVLAKVTRDRLMRDHDREYPDYGFAEHKGYGTPAHLAALAKHGPCPIHRRSFAPIRQPDLELFPLDP